MRLERLPNDGVLLYEANGSLSGSQWLIIARACATFLERARGSDPEVTLEESLEVLKGLVASAMPARPAATVTPYRMAGRRR